MKRSPTKRVGAKKTAWFILLPVLAFLALTDFGCASSPGTRAEAPAAAPAIKPQTEPEAAVVPAQPPTVSSQVTELKLNVVRVDSEETVGEDGKGANAVDGDSSTFWHTQWQDASPEHPHEIIIELSRSCKISGFTYLPRQDDEVNGTIKDYEFYVSGDGKDFGQPVKKGAFGEGKEKKTVTFEPKQCQFIKLKALSEINDQPWTSAAEIGVVAE